MNNLMKLREMKDSFLKTNDKCNLYNKRFIQVQSIEDALIMEKQKCFYSLNLTSSFKGISQKLLYLKWLDLSETNVSRIEGLEKCPQLQTLILSHTQVSHLEGLNNCFKLKTLDLSTTQVSCIEGLENCPQLRTLDLRNTKVSRIEGLEKCTHLQTLNLKGTQVPQDSTQYPFIVWYS